MAVKLAKAMGAEVKVFTTSESKVAAARELGADEVILSRDEAAMDAANRSIDVIIDTVAAPHDLNPYFRTLRVDGALFQLGLPSEDMPPVNPGALIRRRIAYAGFADRRHCRDPGNAGLLRRARRHRPTSRWSGPDQLNDAYDRMVAGDVKYRFVLDTSTLGTPSERADA